jgi:type IV pilus assembly protein PilY1
VNTVVTPVTVVEQQVLTGTATSTFAAINGVTANANKAGACTAGQKLVMQRTTKYNSTVVTTDGLAAAPANSGTTYTFAPGSCVAPLVETTSTPVVETAQYVCSANTTTAFVNAANGTNSQVACGCGAGNTAVKRRVVTYTKTVVTTDSVAAAPTYVGVTTSFSNAVNCSTVTGKTAAATTVVNGATSSSSTGGPTQVAAATTTINGTPVPSDNGGTTLTTASIILNPNPTVTPGVVNATNTPGGTANTLADVAMYYYKTPLRTSGALALPDVPTNSKDINPRQHMVTFTLGLGLTGLMDYIPNYETSTAGDFAKIKNGAAGCSWTTGTCNWPTPKAGTNTTLDDLWHAAVNGRGTYYSASDPNSLADGLSSALTSLKIQTAAASASATSTPNITKTDNSIYSSTFRTVKWDGEITAQRIDPTTGNTQAAIVWSAQTLLDGRVAATSDTRKIYTFSAATGNKLKDFLWANLTTAEKASFEVQCGALSQCPSPGPQRDIANIGQNMVNYLRGQKQYEGTLYRAREHVLGDSVNAAPTFVRVPTLNSNDAVTPSYATYKAANVTRQAVLYVGANDGMLHAFNGDTGAEIWAYVPRIVHPLLSSLASEDWDLNHQFIVDGSPQVADVFDSNAGAWKTILIAGLNKGGRGYYALDITDPNAPKGLWEACSNSSVCAVSDSDFGYSYGYPVVTKRPTDGKWVALVTSGMNNVSPGTGRGYLYVLDALTGAILQKVDTGAGDTTTPSGFAKISGFANNFSVDNTVTHVYGGDLLGNLWRFDMSTSTPTALKLAMLKDSTGKSQSITTRPELTIISGSRVVYVGTGRYLGPDDLADPATLSPALPWAYQQSLYAIKDRSIALGNVRSSSPGLVQQTLTTTSDTTRSTSSKAVDWTGKDGWYIDFNPGNASPGERVNIDPQLIQGTLILATAVPNNSVCKIGGDSWFYQFDYKAGTFVASAQGGVVGQKITGSTVVGVVVIVLPDGTQKAKIKKSDGGDADLGVEKGSPGGLGKRVSWRELIQ